MITWLKAFRLRRKGVLLQLFDKRGVYVLIDRRDGSVVGERSAVRGRYPGVGMARRPRGCEAAEAKWRNGVAREAKAS